MAKNSEGATPGHGESSPQPSIGKGSMERAGATYVPLNDTAHSVNSKTGGPGPAGSDR